MNNATKIAIVIILIVAVGAVIILKNNEKTNSESKAPGEPVENITTAKIQAAETEKPEESKVLPRLVDLGADKCIPCKMMAPILEELKTEYAEIFNVEFIDVWKNPDAGNKYGIRLIPTQIFFDSSGKELFRHEGFFSKEDILAKWKEFGFDFSKVKTADFNRLEPAPPDTRSKDQVCYMCDRDINLKTLVTVKTEKGDVRLCCPHCYFIMYSCLTEDKTDFEKKVTVKDFASGNSLLLTEAVFLAGSDKNGRPSIQAYANTEKAGQTQKISGGNIITLEALKQNELSHRCGFCDRACYPQDAAKVLVSGIQTWGCCSHCALGVAARTGKDIEVHEKDRLTSEPIVVKTINGSIASLEPSTAVAWFGQRQKPDGTWGSAGCFHQGFFVSADNLKKWIERNPFETGKLISIQEALANKMKLSPEQIQKACKIGECSPK